MIYQNLSGEANIRKHAELLTTAFSKLPSGLTPPAAQYLLKYGTWMEGLVFGRISPRTEAQSHFVAVGCGLGEPETPAERYWVEYQDLIDGRINPWKDETPLNVKAPNICTINIISRGLSVTTNEKAYRDANGYRPGAKSTGDSSGYANLSDSGKYADEA